jgi:hypothetical protein
VYNVLNVADPGGAEEPWMNPNVRRGRLLIWGATLGTLVGLGMIAYGVTEANGFNFASLREMVTQFGGAFGIQWALHRAMRRGDMWLRWVGCGILLVFGAIEGAIGHFGGLPWVLAGGAVWFAAGVILLLPDVGAFVEEQRQRRERELLGGIGADE